MAVTETPCTDAPPPATTQEEHREHAAPRLKPAGAYAADFSRMLRNAVRFVELNGPPLLHSVKIVWRDRRIYAQATDRYRLYSEWVAMRPATDQDQMLAEGEALVPAEHVRKLIKRLAGGELCERVELTRQADKLMVATVDYGPTHARLEVTATYPVPVLAEAFIDVEANLRLVDWSSDQPVPPTYRFNRDLMAEVWKVDAGARNVPITFSFANGPSKPVGFRLDNGDDGGIEGILMPIRQAA
jgi:hypothetical protein